MSFLKNVYNLSKNPIKCLITLYSFNNKKMFFYDFKNKKFFADFFYHYSEIFHLLRILKIGLGT